MGACVIENEVLLLHALSEGERREEGASERGDSFFGG
jgi:hypothetical protein